MSTKTKTARKSKKSAKPLNPAQVAEKLGKAKRERFSVKEIGFDSGAMSEVSTDQLNLERPSVSKYLPIAEKVLELAVGKSLVLPPTPEGVSWESYRDNVQWGIRRMLGGQLTGPFIRIRRTREGNLVINKIKAFPADVKARS